MLDGGRATSPPPPRRAGVSVMIVRPAVVVVGPALDVAAQHEGVDQLAGRLLGHAEADLEVLLRRGTAAGDAAQDEAAPPGHVVEAGVDQGRRMALP